MAETQALNLVGSQQLLVVGKDNLVNGTFCGTNGNVALKTWKILAVKKHVFIDFRLVRKYGAIHGYQPSLGAQKWARLRF